ncbi:hypothetical protein CBM2585_A130326 [Cupriavidus taiwanensis]|nr:hypothetical protein CBM2585_A130326 [Cupriavidus taiwanensis]SPC13817.1 hypothetical protein CT19431_80133 [Cupriavidus taiwanensis]
MASIWLASRPMQAGASICSIAALTAGMPTNPKVSPQPTRPSSVLTFSSSESAACMPAPPQTPAAETPPTVNGMRSTMASMLAIFMAPSSRSQSGKAGNDAAQDFNIGQTAHRNGPSSPARCGIEDSMRKTILLMATCAALSACKRTTPDHAGRPARG